MVMSNTDQRIAGRWFAEWGSNPPVFGRATDWLGKLIDHKPERAWVFILALVAFAPDDEALGWVAAGPLEDFLCQHGPAFIDRVEAVAVTSTRFKSCLPRVWGHTRMAPAVYGRLRRAGGMDE